ncbi:hypothetical protein FYK55_22285 [Roseiconus nitratireducens]|uniref:Protein kinase domain-containing protein n=1 Tax=Roseiconus nitratireducens TaxID=2605748 RepID=A0A5M6D4D5_9BACT|nr:hypothetical protein [Roseiconus nitratireducens]KAA5540045.1 hypothetical protein FYK55_22285 [Roseiconus nitratireducens]
MMNDRSPPPVVAPPPNASVEDLIGWLERTRQVQQATALRDLIGDRSLSRDQWIELACVDLIALRRRGCDVRVEDYLQQFPELAVRDDYRLDLIDAELCVRRETARELPRDRWQDRFPDLIEPIGQLMQLGQHLSGGKLLPDESLSPAASSLSPGPVSLGAGPNPDPHAVLGIDDLSGDFSVHRDLTVADAKSVTVRNDETEDDSIDVPIPIKPPAWMVGARCVATGQVEGRRYWLVKGRDADRGDAVAMKILPLPPTVDKAQRTQILDLCEATSRVLHPAWIAPRIAAINNGHLAVVRPWIFGGAYVTPESCDPTDAAAAFEDLSRIAFALAAAHRGGATHGNVIAANLIRDHDGRLNLVDAASSVGGWSHDLACWKQDPSTFLTTRIRHDTVGMLRLVVAVCMGVWEPRTRDQLLEIVGGVDPSAPDGCAIIGEKLQAWSDGVSTQTKRRWWQSG